MLILVGGIAILAMAVVLVVRGTRKPSMASLVVFCVLAITFFALFFYVRSLATVPSLSSVLEGGRTWYLEPGMALGFEAMTLVLFGLFLALAIHAVVRMAARPADGMTVGGEGRPAAAQRLRDLASLRNQGLLDADEYAAKRAEILGGV